MPSMHFMMSLVSFMPVAVMASHYGNLLMRAADCFRESFAEGFSDVFLEGFAKSFLEDPWRGGKPLCTLVYATNE